MYVRLNSITSSWKPAFPTLALFFRPLSVYLAFLVLVIAIALGVFARFFGLDALQLAVDEYYFVRGVHLILEQGVPLFATGGYYVHGLLAQYAIAASVMIFGESGFAYRLAPVLFSLGTVVLLYIYSRRFLEPIPAALVSAMLLVSAWQIEFARFIRMYSQLQFFTLLFFVVFQKTFFEDWWRWRYLPHLIAILTFLTHALGFLLLPFLLVPLLFGNIRRRFSTWTSMAAFTLMSAGTFLFCRLFLKTNFRSGWTVDRLPEGYVFPYQSSSRFRLPEFPFWNISEEALLNLVFFVAVCALVVVVLAAWRYFDRRVIATDIVLGLLLVATLFHMFVVAFGLCFLLVFRYRLYRFDEHPRRSAVMLFVSFVIGACWITYALVSTEWVNSLGGDSPSLFKAVGRTFFGWPDFYSPVVGPWSRELPLLGLLAFAALLYQAAIRIKDQPLTIVQHPAFVVGYIAFCFAIVQSSTTTRYGFFIYPFIILTLGLAAVELLTKLARICRVHDTSSIQILAVLACFGVFSLTEDVQSGQITNISSEDVRFRQGEFRPRALTWYPRSDFESPATFARGLAQLEPNTKLVVVGVPVISYYLQESHAIYYKRDGIRFYNVSRDRGTIDAWSNQRLLSTADELRDYTKSSDRILIIRSTSPDRMEREDFNIDEIWNDRVSSTARLFVGRDNKIEVVLLRLASPVMSSK